MTLVSNRRTDGQDPRMKFGAAMPLGNRHSDSAEVSLGKDPEFPFGDQRGHILELEIVMDPLRMEKRIVSEAGPVCPPERLKGLKVHVHFMRRVGPKERRAVPVQHFNPRTQRSRAILSAVGNIARPRPTMTPSRLNRDAPAICITLRAPLPIEAPGAHQKRSERTASLKPVRYVGWSHFDMISRVGVLAEAPK